jgi:hypothetical protein
MNVLLENFDPASALATDKDGAVLRSIKDVLEQSRAGLRKTMDKGLPPAEFSVASNLQQACQLAQDIVESFWAQPRK